MKINFEDGSFIELEELQDKIRIIMCAKKDVRTTTMSSSVINVEQIKEIMTFLEKYIKV